MYFTLYTLHLTSGRSVRPYGPKGALYTLHFTPTESRPRALHFTLYTPNPDPTFYLTLYTLHFTITSPRNVFPSLLDTLHFTPRTQIKDQTHFVFSLQIACGAGLGPASAGGRSRTPHSGRAPPPRCPQLRSSARRAAPTARTTSGRERRQGACLQSTQAGKPRWLTPP